ncbi:hypothetical protein IC582_028450 [Cucumis melo]
MLLNINNKITNIYFLSSLINFLQIYSPSLNTCKNLNLFFPFSLKTFPSSFLNFLSLLSSPLFFSFLFPSPQNFQI